MMSQNRGQFNSEFLSNDRGRMTMLDRALEGASVEHKARVRGLLLSYGIETDDHEFYMLFVAFGHLTVLVQEAPENWRTLFDEFEAKLDQWAQQNLRTLAAINQQSDNTERMARGFQALVTSTTSLKQETEASLMRLDKLNVTLTGLTSRLSQTESYRSSLLDRFKQTDQRIERLENLVALTSGCSLALLVVLGLGGGFAYRQIAKQQEFTQVLQGLTREQTGWLLEKASRQECATRVKPATDPQCQQYR